MQNVNRKGSPARQSAAATPAAAGPATQEPESAGPATVPGARRTARGSTAGRPPRGSTAGRPAAGGSRRKPPPPAGLAAKGRAIWANVTKHYDLGPDELLVLAQVCKVSDRLATLDAITAAEPVIIRGSHGGRVVHPAVVEARQQQLVLARLVRLLNLPELPPEVMPGGQLTAVPGGPRSRRSHRRTG